MFDNGLKVRIEGGPFKSGEPVEFPLLCKINPQSKTNMYSTLIYGRNGSGKTTISNSLDEYTLNEQDRSLNVSLVDLCDNEYTDANNIFVYGENLLIII